MADKEYILGNKARELLTYTNQATKIVTDDVSQRDVRKILQKIAALDDIRDVKQVCGQMIGYLDRKDKQGFTKAAYRCYGEDMRKTAKAIVRDIHAANGKMFVIEYEERLRLIGQILDGCSLMLEYIQICLDMGVISLEKSKVWTKKVLDVKYMSASWKKNDGARAKKLEAEKQADVLYAVPESGYLPAGDERTVPTGAVLSFLALAPPRGYLACDGAVHNVAEYPRLAAYIQAQFGAKNYFGGDGEATFAVPDLRNLFLRGYHGEAEEQLSGEIGQRQEGTVVTIPHIFGGTVVGMPLKKYEEMQADEVRNAIGYRGYYSASVDQSEPNPMYIVPRPVNMAVLYCIKT